MHISIIKPLSAACVVTAALTASVNANAQHYHGYVYSNTIYGSADDGSSSIIKTNILHQTCNTFDEGNFVTNEMWYMTDSSNNYWVEVGVYDGEGTNSITNPCENDVLFWSDSRPGGGFNTHFYNNGWSLGSYYQVEVAASGSCTWNVRFGGLELGTSTNNCPGSGRILYAGAETTTQSEGSIQGFTTLWQAENGSGVWSSSGWGQLWMWGDSPPYIKQVGNSPWGAQTEEVLNENW
jgi:hypothetical protein